ncbi:uncharacterized protein LOC144055238 isoform X2 [Vanacampus margaritifer]
MIAFAASLVTLGVTLVSFTASQTPPSLTTESKGLNFTMAGAMAENGIKSDTTENSNDTIMSSTMSYKNASVPVMPGTNQNGNKTEGTSYETTPAPLTISTKMTEKQDKSTTTAKPNTNKGYDTTGIIILILIIVVAVGFGIACYISKRRAKRYAVDFSSRADEANVPLSPVEPMLANDTAPQNGLQTFESGDKRSKEAEKEEEAPKNEEEDEPKAEAATETESPAPPADDSRNNAKDGEAVKPDEPDQQSSHGTAEESPKNENNSNNSDVTQKKDFKMSTTFWEISLDSQV